MFVMCCMFNVQCLLCLPRCVLRLCTLLNCGLHVACWARGGIKLTDPCTSWTIDGARDSTAAVHRTSLLTRHVFFSHSSPVCRCLPLFPRLAHAMEAWSKGTLCACKRLRSPPVSLPLSPFLPFSPVFFQISQVLFCHSLTPP